ncbi:MAG: DUF5615 family PIN-like protein [Terriglobales bacterium]
MRLLLDECVPRSLKGELPGHDVHTVAEMGWSSKRNSELLQLMLGQRFECLVTVDQNLQFQQSISAAGVAVVIIVAKTNRLKELRPLIPRVLSALAGISAGETVRVL